MSVAETTVAEQTAVEKLYEGMFLLDSGRFATDAKGSADQILAMIEKNGGSIVAHRPWQDGASQGAALSDLFQDARFGRQGFKARLQP
jgi:hypothetical protein